MNKRGYFFLIDAILASVILFLGLFALFASPVRSDQQVQPLQVLEDLTTTISVIPVSQTLDPYYLNVLLPAGVVDYTDQTPIELAYFLTLRNCGSVNCTSHARNYTASLLTNGVGAQYGAELFLNGTSIGRKEGLGTRYTVVRRIVLYVRVNESTSVGPVLGEVRLWG